MIQNNWASLPRLQYTREDSSSRQSTLPPSLLSGGGIMSSSLPSQRTSTGRLYLPGRDYYDSSLYSRQEPAHRGEHPSVGRLKNTNIQVRSGGGRRPVRCSLQADRYIRPASPILRRSDSNTSNKRAHYSQRRVHYADSFSQSREQDHVSRRNWAGLRGGLQDGEEEEDEEYNA